MDMLRIELTELQTLVIAIIALFIGRQLRRSIPALSKLDIPNAVVGAAIVAVADATNSSSASNTNSVNNFNTNNMSSSSLGSNTNNINAAA